MRPRSVYVLDHEITTLDKVHNDDPDVFEFRAHPSKVDALRSPQCTVTTPKGKVQWKLCGFRKIPGPPVDGEHLYQIDLEQIIPPRAT